MTLFCSLLIIGEKISLLRKMGLATVGMMMFGLPAYAEGAFQFEWNSLVSAYATLTPTVGLMGDSFYLKC